MVKVLAGRARVRNVLGPTALCLLTCLTAVCGHDMWLEPSTFFAEPGRRIVIRNGNGTIFGESENAVTPDRISTRLGLGPSGERLALDSPRVEGAWLSFGFVPRREGNYWVGVGSRPRTIELSASDFKNYLEHDGLPHVIRERQEKGIQDRDESEEYSKYVKTYLQVGAAHSPNYDDPLGLTIEMVPLRNPYRLSPGQDLPVRVLFRGSPLQGFLIHAGTREAGELHQAYTDSGGSASFPVSQAGQWFLRGIHLFEVEGKKHSYESYWASLTFEVKQPAAPEQM